MEKYIGHKIVKKVTVSIGGMETTYEFCKNCHSYYEKRELGCWIILYPYYNIHLCGKCNEELDRSTDTKPNDTNVVNPKSNDDHV